MIRADYGIDAPSVLRALGVVEGAALFAAILGLVLDIRWVFWIGVASFAYVASPWVAPPGSTLERRRPVAERTRGATRERATRARRPGRRLHR
jgi:hypothetical protein